jgi:hypothetical protein
VKGNRSDGILGSARILEVKRGTYRMEVLPHNGLPLKIGPAQPSQAGFLTVPSNIAVVLNGS